MQPVDFCRESYFDGLPRIDHDRVCIDARKAHFDGPFADTLLIKGNLITMDRSRPRADRYEWLAPIRTANELGIHTASHSDYPVSAADPLLRIQDLVTRRTEAGIVVGEGQRIAVEDAIRAWTLDAAYATFDENSKGSLTPGKLADFVVLGGDPTKTDPLEIRRLPVLETFIDGKSVWKASDSRGIPKGGEGTFFDPSED